MFDELWISIGNGEIWMGMVPKNGEITKSICRWIGVERFILSVPIDELPLEC
jgi:hypothetical protein